jgi:hypothetical protein
MWTVQSTTSAPSNTLHADMLDWCLKKSKKEEKKKSTDHKVLPPLSESQKKNTKAELFKYSKLFNEKKVYESVQIAKSFGFKVLRTPSYHCEVQPIEGLWDIVKQKVAHEFVKDETLAGLKNRLLCKFADVTSGQLNALWEKTVQVNRNYYELLESEKEAMIDNEDIESSEETYGDEEESEVENKENEENEEFKAFIQSKLKINKNQFLLY